MEAIALRRTSENLGLQALFADVGFFAGSKRLPKTIDAIDRTALDNLKEFLHEVVKGLDLSVQSRQQGYGSVAALSDLAKAERAYRSIRPILPVNAEDARLSLERSEQVVDRLITGHARRTDLNELHDFCRKVLNYLDRERFDQLRNPETLLP